MNGEGFIQFTGVHKTFGRNVVFAGLDLAVRRGEIITIIGGSGTGKSVLLKLLIGLLKVDAGSITVDGEEVTGYNDAQMLPIRRRIAMLFQGSALFDSLTVGENVAYPLREQTDFDDGTIRSRVAEVLELVGLPGIEKMMPADLSGGMKKRVGLARAIAVGPECILYDEPTTGLDPLNTRRISELVSRMREKIGATSIVVTHDMQSAFMVSDRIAMLDEKRIVMVDTPANIKRCEIPRVRRFIHAMDPDFHEAAGGA